MSTEWSQIQHFICVTESPNLGAVSEQDKVPCNKNRVFGSLFMKQNGQYGYHLKVI